MMHHDVYEHECNEVRVSNGDPLKRPIPSSEDDVALQKAGGRIRLVCSSVLNKMNRRSGIANQVVPQESNLTPTGPSP